MMQTYALQVASTGETILQIETDLSILTWQRRTCKKILKNGARAERFKEAIKQKDVITAWVNYDLFNLSADLENLNSECYRVFKGLDSDAF